MTSGCPGRYDRTVAAVRDALRRAAAGFAILLGFFHPVPANAATGSFLMGDQSVVQVLAGARSEITVKGWDRPNVQFDTDDEAAQVTRRPITFGTAQTPLSVSIPVQTIAVRDPVTGSDGPRNAAARRIPLRLRLPRRRARHGAHPDRGRLARHGDGAGHDRPARHAHSKRPGRGRASTTTTAARSSRSRPAVA